MPKSTSSLKSLLSTNKPHIYTRITTKLTSCANCLLIIASARPNSSILPLALHFGTQHSSNKREFKTRIEILWNGDCIILRNASQSYVATPKKSIGVKPRVIRISLFNKHDLFMAELERELIQSCSEIC